MDNQNEDLLTNTPSEQIELKKYELLEKVVEQIPAYLKYFDDKRLKHETPITKLTIWSFVSLIAVVIISSGILVYNKILDSASYTFIIGTLLGYLFGVSKYILNRNDE